MPEPCQYCDRVCINTEELQGHIKGHHRGDFAYDLITDTFQCRACLKTFQSESGVKIHIKKAHKVTTSISELLNNKNDRPRPVRPKYECQICHKTFKSKKTLKFHLVCHSEVKENVKPVLNKFGDENGGLIGQSRQKRDIDSQKCPRMNRVHCSVCQLMFTTDEDLQRHKRMNPNGECHDVLNNIQNKRVRCINRACPKTFKSRKELEDHMRLNHERNSLYKCKFCAKICRDNYELNRHERRKHTFNESTGKIEYKCRHCEQSFTHPSHLKAHERALHLKTGLNCKQCGLKFEQMEELRKHEKVHTKTGRHPCGYCGKYFKHKGDASRHERMHAGQGWRKCRFCLKVFRDAGVLNKHERRHLQVKLFRCVKCGMFLATSFTLKMHMKTHE